MTLSFPSLNNTHWPSFLLWAHYSPLCRQEAVWRFVKSCWGFDGPNCGRGLATSRTQEWNCYFQQIHPLLHLFLGHHLRRHPERHQAHMWLRTHSSPPFLHRGRACYNHSFRLTRSGQLQVGHSISLLSSFTRCWPLMYMPSIAYVPGLLLSQGRRAQFFFGVPLVPTGCT